MAIKKYYVNRPKDGYQYDRQRNQYFSWGYDIWLDGTRRHQRGFFTQRRAEEAVKALRENAQNKALGILPRSESPYLIELFQKKLDTLTVKRDRTRAKRIFNCFLRLLPDRIKVIELKRAHLKLYIDKRLADGVSGATVKRELVPVREVLNNADQYMVELDGYTPPRRPRLDTSKSRKSVPIKRDQRIALLKYLLAPESVTERVHQAAARRRVGQFLQLCLLTVSRPGEIAAIRRTDIDLDTDILTIHGSKTDKKKESTRTVPITSTIRSILLERLSISRSEYVITAGGKVTGKMRDVFKVACESVGVKYGRKDPDGITFYSARHTAITTLQHSNRVDLKTTGDFAGQSDETMTLLYTHTSPETLKIIGEILEENMGSSLLDREFLESFSNRA